MSNSATKKKATQKKSKASASKKKVTKEKKVEKKVIEEKPKKVVKTKKPAEKQAPPEPKVRPERIKLGPAPTAMVESGHDDLMRERAARGFSRGELSSAGVPVEAAKREGLSLDVRRRSVHDGNVEKLKGWFKHSPAATKKTEPSAAAKKK